VSNSAKSKRREQPTSPRAQKMVYEEEGERREKGREGGRKN
jgi:hypothetical protein